MIGTMAKLTAAELEALGVYDSGARHAAQRLELLEYLVSLGATAEDLVAYRDDPGLATVLALRGGGALTVAEAEERTGVPAEKLLRITRAAGLAEPGADDRAFSEQLAGLAAGMAAAPARARDGLRDGPPR
jgi:hypothetical protein